MERYTIRIPRERAEEALREQRWGAEVAEIVLATERTHGVRLYAVTERWTVGGVEISASASGLTPEELEAGQRAGTVRREGPAYPTAEALEAVRVYRASRPRSWFRESAITRLREVVRQHPELHPDDLCAAWNAVNAEESERDAIR